MPTSGVASAVSAVSVIQEPRVIEAARGPWNKFYTEPRHATLLVPTNQMMLKNPIIRRANFLYYDKLTFLRVIFLHRDELTSQWTNKFLLENVLLITSVEISCTAHTELDSKLLGRVCCAPRVSAGWLQVGRLWAPASCSLWPCVWCTQLVTGSRAPGIAGTPEKKTCNSYR